jgi:hypothetical protein
MPYVGQIQIDPYMCVFASLAAAVNYVADQQVWTQQSLLTEWRKLDMAFNELNFGNVAPVAVQPVATKVKYRQHWDGPTPISDADYLTTIRDCIDRGGVVVVSLEVANLAGGNIQRIGNWHMLSLIARNGNVFEAWDTNGSALTITDAQLISYVPRGASALTVHDKHDMALVEPV